MSRQVGRWQRYWFGDGGRTSVAILRIALALATLLTLALLEKKLTANFTPFYRPVGPWMIVGHHAPPVALVSVLFIIAWTSSGLMLLGLFSRVAHVVSCISGIALAALVFAASRSWSHQFNVVFLASIAFLGARSGDTLSLDAWLRRRRGLSPINRAAAYQWTIRLVQLAVALMFAGACFHKFLHAHFTLRWALSDNLRHQLLVQYDLADLPRTPVANWIIDDPWKYRTAAVLNLISQAMPLAAVFLMKRPVLRACAGSFFLVETIALSLVVDLWNPHWLPLMAVFIDWDRLLRVKDPPITAATPKRATRIWIIAFIVYDAFTAFVPTVDQKLNTFPFSSFPMFSTVRAHAPYMDHQAYDLAADSFEVTCDRPLDISIQQWFDHANRGTWKIRDPKQLERKLRSILATAQQRWSWWPIRGVRLWLTIYEAPAYPAPAHFEEHRIAVMGEVLPDGTYRSAFGTPTNVDLTGAEQLYYKDDVPTPIPLPEQHGELGNPVYFVARAKDGTPWLTSVHSKWKWE